LFRFSGFKPDDLTNLINHSDAIILFVDDKILDTLDIKKVPAIQAVISLDDFSMKSSLKPEVKKIILLLKGNSLKHLLTSNRLT